MVSINIIDFISQVAEHIPFQVVWFDTEAKVQNGNQVWVQAMGSAKLDELLGRTPHDYLKGEQAARLSEQVIRVVQSGTMQVEKIPNCTQTGKVRNTVTAGYPLPDENGAIAGVLVICYEETDAVEPGTAAANERPELASPRDNGKSQEAAQNRKMLVSGLLHQLLAEAGNAHRNQPVRFQIAIADMAQFGFIVAENAQLRQSILHLIKRAVDNLSAKKNGSVTLKLDANAETMTLTVHDNGKGLNFEMLDRMLNREIHLGDNVASIDPGMQQIWKMLEQNNGILHVETMLAEGTSILLTFPRTAMPDWISTQINLSEDSIVVILDPDTAVHKEWNRRLDIYRHLYPGLQLHYFTEAANVQRLIGGLNQEEAERVVLLSEYELSDQNMNGLQIIESAGLRNATLVTRLHDITCLQNSVVRLGAKMLPKHLLALVPLQFDRDPPK